MIEQTRGFSFPFRFNERGGTAFSGGSEKLRENIISLLLTGVGERVMRRDYGGGLRQLVHDPNNDALRAIMRHQAAKAIERWEPGAHVESVAIAQREGELSLEIVYTSARSLQTQSLSVPIGLGVFKDG